MKIETRTRIRIGEEEIKKALAIYLNTQLNPTEQIKDDEVFFVDRNSDVIDFFVEAEYTKTEEREI